MQGSRREVLKEKIRQVSENPVHKLKRNITVIEAVFYGLGIIIGAGIYVLIAPAAGLAGNAVWMSFLLAAVLATFTGLSYAELASMFPRSAAEYIYIRSGYNSHLYAFIIGWLIIFTAILSISTVALGFTGYFSALLGVGQEAARFVLPWISIGIISLMTLVNYVGIKETSKTNVALVATVIAGLILVIVLGFGDLERAASVDYLVMPLGLTGVFFATSLVFFAYLGFEEIVNIAEETRSPRKAIPTAIVMSVLVSTVLYVLTAMSVVSIMGWENLSESTAPISDVVAAVLGPAGGLVMSVLAVFATASTILGLILVNSRMMYGMSRCGSLPRLFSRVSTKGTPHLALLATAVIASAFVFIGDIGVLAGVTSMGSLVIFLSINLVLIWLRFTRPGMHRPFKVPFNVGNYPLIAGLGVVISVFMLFQFEADTLFIGGVIALIGAVIFLVYKRRERVLEKELKNIVDAIKQEAER